MRVQLIHGGEWDGWRIVELDDGARRIVSDLSAAELAIIRTRATLEDISPEGTSARAEALGLSVVRGGA